MNKFLISCAAKIWLIPTLMLCSPAQSALHNRGNNLVYDDVLNVTWLKDANFAWTSGFEPVVTWSPGQMSWAQAVFWTENLDVAGYDDWRLPKITPRNGVAFDIDPNSPTRDVGGYITSTTSELSYMYYVNLGLEPNPVTQDCGHGPVLGGGQCLVNSGLFKNIKVSPGQYFYGQDYPRNPDLAAWAFSMNGGNVSTSKASADGYAWAVRDGDVSLASYSIINDNSQPFSGKSFIGHKGAKAGQVVELVGSVEIIRNGVSMPVPAPFPGFPPIAIYENDRIITNSDSAVTLQLIDGSYHSISAERIESISELKIDSRNRDENWFLDNLNRVFIYTSSMINENTITEDLPTNGIGIRADAADYINEEYLDASVKMNVGSPIALYTAIDVPDTPFDLSFQYIFLTEMGSLSVFLDDILITSIVGDHNSARMVQRAILNISDSNILDLGMVKLSFLFDGPSGSQLIIDDIAMPGLMNGNFNLYDQAWFGDGPGTLEFVATISEEKLLEITAVPEPRTYVLLLIGLWLVSYMAQRRKSRCW